MENWKKLGNLSPEQIKRMQSKKFKFAIKHLVPYSPFYQEFFKKHNLSFGDFNSIDDIKKLPIISKNDIVPTDENPAKSKEFILQPDEKLIKKYAPKSMLIKIAGKKIIGMDVKDDLLTEFKPVHIHMTTGRSANQIPFLYTLYDLENLKESGKRIFTNIGASTDDIAINCFPFAPHLAFWLGFHGTTYSKVMALQTGGGKMMGTGKIINVMDKMNATIFIAIPGYAYHLIRQAANEGADLSSLKHLVFGGERVSPALRKKVKSLLKECGAENVNILATYALTEAKTAWVQCHEESGYHLYPDFEYIELIDENNQPVKEGEKGEIVYTALDWRGSMVMRYQTADVCQSLITSTPCPHCGRTVPRLHFDIERRTELKELSITKVKGELINLNVFYQVIHEIDEIDEWQVEIKKKNDDPFELDELYIHIAVKKGVDPSDVEPKLEERILDNANIRPIIINHDLDTLIEMLGMEKELKEKRIIDSRPKK